MAEQLTVKIGADISGLDAGIREATKTVSGFGDTLKGAFLGGFGADLASRAFGAITTSVTDAIHALAEVDKIAGQTAAVIKSTGGAAGVTADQVGALADALERKTGIEAESIQKGQNLLLTFTNIKDAAGANNDIFSQATRIMADLATAMGGDASGAAIQLGKALNDPTQGIAALTRVGVTFTDAQKEQIKALQESGNLMGAQRIILAELRKEFGGSAEAAGATFAGALDRAKNAVDSIAEAMLSAKVPMFTAALGAVADGAYAISDAITKGDIIGLINRAFGPGAKALIVGIGAAMASSLAPQIINVTRLAVTMGATYAKSAAAMVVANAPLIAAIAAISFAAYPFIKNWETVSNLFIYAWRTIVNAVTAAWRDITGGAKIAFEILSGNFKRVYADAVAFLIGPLGRSFKALFDRLPAFVKDAVGGIDFTLPKMNFTMGEIPGASQAYAEFKQMASNAIDTVKGVVMISKEQISSTFSTLPGEVNGALNSVMGVITGSTAKMTSSLKSVGAVAGDMGKAVAEGHEKVGKAAEGHGRKVEGVALSLFSLEKQMWKTLEAANKLKHQIWQSKWDKISADVTGYVKAVGYTEQPLEDAKKRIKDMDDAAKYWNDTTDRTAEKMDILRRAIDEARSRGIDPANMSLETAKQLFDEMASKQTKATEKTVTFGEALGAIGGIVGATSATLEYFGAGDSPLAGMLQKVTGGIQLFNQWGSAITTAGTAFTNLGGITGIVGGIIAVATAPITLITLGIGLLIWAVHDAVKAFGGWPKVFTAVKIAFTGLGLGLSKVGEFIVEGVINTIGAAWTGLVNTMRTGANVIIDVVNAAIRGINALGGNMAEINRFDMIEFKPVELAWSKGFEEDMVKLQAEFAAAPPMQEWQVTNPLEEIKKMMAGNAKDAEIANETFKKTMALDKKAAAFGDSASLASNKMAALKSGMEEMLDKGIDPASQAFQKLKSEYDMLKTSPIDTVLSNLTKTIEQVDKKAELWGATVETITEKQNAFKGAIEALLAEGVSPASQAIAKLQAQYDELERAKPEKTTFNAAYQGMVDGANALMQKAIDTGDEALKRRAAESYQTAIREGTTVVKPETPPVIINYNGSGKWTREDAQQLGALIVNEVKAAGVR